MLLANQLDAVLRDLLPRDQHTLLPEPYHPHAPLLRDAELVTEPSAVRCIAAHICAPKCWQIVMLVFCGPKVIARAERLQSADMRDAFSDMCTVASAVTVQRGLQDGW